MNKKLKLLQKIYGMFQFKKYDVPKRYYLYAFNCNSLSEIIYTILIVTRHSKPKLCTDSCL